LLVVFILAGGLAIIGVGVHSVSPTSYTILSGGTRPSGGGEVTSLPKRLEVQPSEGEFAKMPSDWVVFAGAGMAIARVAPPASLERSLTPGGEILLGALQVIGPLLLLLAVLSFRSRIRR
jgi:hypothetical protein